MKGSGDEPFREDMHLKGTKPNFGGLRWWFICPLIQAGAPCNRRVKKLYLPPSGEWFGCRSCHKLIYQSAQANDARINKLVKDPIALLRAMKSEDPMEKLRGLSAYTKMQGWAQWSK